MAEAINNGGPAFPVLEEDGRGNLALTSTGMTKRDFFAAMAMHAFIMNAANGTAFGGGHEDTNLTYAKASYAMADAMLKARAE